MEIPLHYIFTFLQGSSTPIFQMMNQGKIRVIYFGKYSTHFQTSFLTLYQGIVNSVALVVSSLLASWYYVGTTTHVPSKQCCCTKNL